MIKRGHESQAQDMNDISVKVEAPHSVQWDFVFPNRDSPYESIIDYTTVFCPKHTVETVSAVMAMN